MSDPGTEPAPTEPGAPAADPLTVLRIKDVLLQRVRPHGDQETVSAGEPLVVKVGPHSGAWLREVTGAPAGQDTGSAGNVHEASEARESEGDAPSGPLWAAFCGGETWPLDRRCSVLKAADLVYSFRIEGRPHVLAVAVAFDTPEQVLEVLESVLLQRTRFQLAPSVAPLIDPASPEEVLDCDQVERGESLVRAGSGGGIERTFDEGAAWVTDAVERAGGWLASAIRAGALAMATSMERGSEAFASRTKSLPPRQVSERTKRVSSYVRRGAQGTAKAAAVAAGAAVQGATWVGTRVVRAAKDGAQRNPATARATSSRGLRSVGKLAMAGIVAASDVAASLVEASHTVVRSAAKNTARAVGHRYGPDVGTIADDSAEAVLSVADAQRHVGVLSTRGVARATARATLRQAGRDGTEEDAGLDGLEDMQEPATALTPDRGEQSAPGGTAAQKRDVESG